MVDRTLEWGDLVVGNLSPARVFVKTPTNPRVDRDCMAYNSYFLVIVDHSHLDVVGLFAKNADLLDHLNWGKFVSHDN